MTESTYNPIIQLEKVKKRIALACAQYNRKPEEVTLVGVSKTKPASQITQLHLLGLKSIGENYLNEATVKQEELKELDIDWHYIGKIQSNKTRIIANSFSWVHGVDRLKIAQRINQQSEQKNKINILLQINLDDEDSKSGVHLDSAKTLCEEVSKLENLHLRGFMAIPKPRDNFEQQLECLSKLKQLKDEVNKEQGLHLDTISAGMSNDLEAAIAAGSTMVRIGTDLFGAR